MCHSVCKPSSSHKLLPSKGRYHDAADVACLPLLLLQQSGYCGRSLSGHLHGHDLSSSISVNTERSASQQDAHTRDSQRSRCSARRCNISRLPLSSKHILCSWLFFWYISYDDDESVVLSRSWPLPSQQRLAEMSSYRLTNVHVWAQERDKEVNYACRCRVAQSTAKHLFSDFQTETTTHEFDMAKNHCRRDLQTEGWTHQQKTSLTKLGNKKLSSSATPSCIISQCLCIRLSTASDDADDAVPCSIRTDVPVSKWNSDHKTSTNVTGAWLQTNILHSEIPRHAYLFPWFQNNAMTCLISKQNWTVQYWTVQWFP